MLWGRSSQSQETGGSAEGKGSKQQELLSQTVIYDPWFMVKEECLEQGLALLQCQKKIET